MEPKSLNSFSLRSDAGPLTSVVQNYLQATRNFEEQHLYPKASFSKNHNRLQPIKEDYRLPYRRDSEQILHSKAYARYSDKTQVVYLVDNDHVAHRALHVQLVSSFARGIAQILNFNLDLVEAIALGHDVGHPPFGHEGEGYLCELSKEFGCGTFAHPWQSCRLLSEIEPLNLGLQVYDGFLCHDGGMSEPRLVPVYGKTWNDHLVEKEQKRMDAGINIIPATLEGCLVKLCDTMSYLGKDLEDAISLGIIERRQVPETLLGNTNAEILAVLSQDIIVNSYGKDYIGMSPLAFDALKKLREFNFANIYLHPKLKVESKKIKRSYRILFEILLNDHEKNGNDSYLWRHFLHNKSDTYLNGASPVRMVIDYISGMTDGYFLRTLKKMILPSEIELI